MWARVADSRSKLHSSAEQRTYKFYLGGWSRCLGWFLLSASSLGWALTSFPQSRWSRYMHMALGTSFWCCTVSVTPGRAAGHLSFPTLDLEPTEEPVWT